MSRETLEKWRKAATELTEVRASFSPPIRVILGEAVDVARFTQAYWEPVKDTADKILRPGLALAGAKLHPTIGAEILELQDALQTAQTDYLLTVAPAQPDVRARGEFVLAEITAASGCWTMGSRTIATSNWRRSNPSTRMVRRAPIRWRQSCRTTRSWRSARQWGSMAWVDSIWHSLEKRRNSPSSCVNVPRRQPPRRTRVAPWIFAIE